jgi:predicted acyltransferase
MRLTSLDVFRGMAIASMILVNNPGSWQQVYPPLLHAPWHGFTPTDLIFPAFLFISGVAMAFSFAKYTHSPNFPPAAPVYVKILRRALILFGLGLFLNGSTLVLKTLLQGHPLDFGTLRIMGVLQRISLAYLLGAIAILNLSRRRLGFLCLAILLGYWFALTQIPVPGYGPGDLSPKGAGTLVAYLDRLILTPPHILGDGSFEPEGLLSTLPSVVTTLLGFFIGDWLQKQPVTSRTSLQMAGVAVMTMITGSLWGLVFPINKQLWTSSFVVLSAGWSLLLLAACYELVEVRQWRSWAFPFKVMGLNAIFVFVASGFLARILLFTPVSTATDAPSLYSWMYRNGFVPILGELHGSFAIALVTLLFWTWILWGLYRRRWFFKL